MYKVETINDTATGKQKIVLTITLPNGALSDSFVDDMVCNAGGDMCDALWDAQMNRTV